MRTRSTETTPKSAAAKKATPPKKAAAAAAASAETPTAGTAETTSDATPPRTTPKSAKVVKAAGNSSSKLSTAKAAAAADAPGELTPPAEPKPESTANEKKPAAASKTPQKKAVKGRPAKASAAKVGVAEEVNLEAEESKLEAEKVEGSAEAAKMEVVEVKEEPSGVTNKKRKQETEGRPEPKENATTEKDSEAEKMEDAPAEADGVTAHEDNTTEDVGNGVDEHVDLDNVQEPGEEDIDAEEVDEEEGSGEEEGDEDEEEEEVGAEADEQVQITDMAKQRKLKKAQEIFVGGLDRDVEEGDLRKAFEAVGEVVEVRLHKDLAGKRNKGFAFVVFANKEQAARAIAEMKNPVICGKRCGTAPSEDNDTLFLGNICNSWTREAIKRKLKEYGAEGVERITIVEDTQNAGLSRGFAFVEFACHNDAMVAYKRLQKPDVIFGHPERTVKVAFAEPLREPDAEVMAQVKSVFVDGMPPYWDEDRVREHFKAYGEIERIILARNMQTAKRRDFGFVNFTTHEAAVACIEGVNNTELGDGKTKMKVRARLSNPLPKTQAVKGGMRGGFRIGQMGMRFSRVGRGFSRGRFSFGRAGIMGGRSSYPRGRGSGNRFFSPSESLEYPEESYSRRQFRGRGGRGGSARNFYEGRGPVRARNLLHSQRQQFHVDHDFSEPFDGDDFYFYEDAGHGFKRPFSLIEHDPGYLESRTRVRRRFDFNDSLSNRMRYRGSSGGRFSDYYGSDYDGTGYSSRYSERGGGYYY